MSTKICITCGKELEESEFYGKRKSCKKCANKKKHDSNCKKYQEGTEFTCRKCHITKPKKEFNLNNPSICRECISILREQYFNKPENVEKYKNKKIDPEFIKQNNATKKKYIEKGPFYEIKALLELKARQAIIMNKRKGILKKNSECNCSNCGAKGKWSGPEGKWIEYHHIDYRNLDYAIPLCKKCHSKYHRLVQTIYPAVLFKGIEIPDKFKKKCILE